MSQAVSSCASTKLIVVPSDPSVYLRDVTALGHLKDGGKPSVAGRCPARTWDKELGEDILAEENVTQGEENADMLDF